MAFKKVSGARKYFKYTECKPGDQLVSAGVYIGSEQGRFGIQHIFKQADGQSVCLNSAGHLNWLLNEYAEPGKSLVNIVYAGKECLTRGGMRGKDAHKFELEIDDGEGDVITHVDSEPSPAPSEIEVPDISL